MRVHRSHFIKVVRDSDTPVKICVKCGELDAQTLSIKCRAIMHRKRRRRAKTKSPSTFTPTDYVRMRLLVASMAS